MPAGDRQAAPLSRPTLLPVLTGGLALALRRLRARPLRSFLLLQGTIWGVAVSLFPTAVMEGTREAVRGAGAGVGADRIAITSDPTRVDPVPLTVADVLAIAGRWEDAGIPLLAAAGVQVLAPPSTTDARPGVPAALLLGAPDAFLARNLSLARGRRARLDAAATGASASEAVVEGRLAEELAAQRGDALGARLALPDGREAVVVGVLATRPDRERRLNDLGFDTEHPVFRGATGRLLLNLGVPFGDDAWKRSDRAAWVAGEPARADWIFLRGPPERLREGASLAEAALHGAGKDAVLFRAFFYSLLLHRELDRFTGVSLALFVACLAMSAVVMASVGLLTALSRQPEIAIHRVEGATKRHVLAQFLVEGLVLSVVGALLGWALGCGLAELRVALEPLAGVTWTFPWGLALVTLGVSVVVGVLASLLPAWRAVSVAPVEALADE